jgi:hypothetical protein
MTLVEGRKGVSYLLNPRFLVDETLVYHALSLEVCIKSSKFHQSADGITTPHFEERRGLTGLHSREHDEMELVRHKNA